MDSIGWKLSSVCTQYPSYSSMRTCIQTPIYLARVHWPTKLPVGLPSILRVLDAACARSRSTHTRTIPSRSVYLVYLVYLPLFLSLSRSRFSLSRARTYAIIRHERRAILTLICIGSAAHHTHVGLNGVLVAQAAQAYQRASIFQERETRRKRKRPENARRGRQSERDCFCIHYNTITPCRESRPEPALVDPLEPSAASFRYATRCIQ